MRTISVLLACVMLALPFSEISAQCTIPDQTPPVILNTPPTITVSAKSGQCQGVVTIFSALPMNAMQLDVDHSPASLFGAPSGSHWQAFTANHNGKLVQVGYLSNSAFGYSGTLTIFAGGSPGGTVLYSGPYGTNSSGWQYQAIPYYEAPTVSAGQQYTIQWSSISPSIAGYFYNGGSSSIVTLYGNSVGFNAIVFRTYVWTLSGINASAPALNAMLNAGTVAQDNCTVASFTSSINAGAQIPLGTTPVTQTAVDENGNTTVCNFNIIVQDGTTASAAVNPICANDTTTLLLNNYPGGDTVYWYSAPNAQGSLLGTGPQLHGAGPGTYYVRFANCNLPYRELPVSVALRQGVGTVDSIPSAVYCNGVSTDPIYFTGPVSGTIFNWSSAMPSIGAASSGVAAIPPFTATNNGGADSVAQFTVTPYYQNCAGPARSFTITVHAGNPTSFSYAGTPFCNSGIATPLTAGFSGGVFSAPAGLQIDSSNGAVDLAASVPGHYTVTCLFAPGSSCTATQASLDISAIPALLVSGDSLLCGGRHGFLTASGATNYSWSSSALSLDASAPSLRVAAGLRLLKAGYTGPILRLRRSLDNSEQDFYASGNDLDLAAIRSWVGLSNGYCTKIYDQSGQGHDFIQANVNAQPQLLLSGNNGRPVLHFNTAQRMQLNTNFPAPFTMIAAARQTGGARGRVISSVNSNWLLGWWNGNASLAYYEGWVAEGGVPGNNAFAVVSGSANAGVGSFYQNGILVASNSGGSTGPNGIQLNGYQGSSEMSDCEILDVLLYDAVLADAERFKIENGIWNYYINPAQVFTSASSNSVAYTVTGSNPGCPASTQMVTVQEGVSGNPMDYGNGVWNVYAWNAGAPISNNTWQANYAGYYTAGGLNVNTANQWPSSGSPSEAAGYMGCIVSADNHSWSARRQGFPCGYYRLDVPSHDDGAQLWINDSLVWQHNGCCDGHNAVWTGNLGPDSRVIFRGCDGGGDSYGNLNFTQLNVSIGYNSSAYCSSTGVVQPIISGFPGGHFRSSPDGLALDSLSGSINTSSSAGGIYTVTYSFPGSCSSITAATTTVRIISASGNPSDYGEGVWNVYAWNSGGAPFTASTWQDNYAGYYTATGLNFNTTNQWNPGGAPSDAPGYSGCSVGADNHSWSARRHGFPCGYYRLDIPGHDDGAQLWINDTLVWEHNGCCDSHNNVWSGFLGLNSRVIFRGSDGNNGSEGSLNFVMQELNVSISYGNTSFCASTGETTPTITGINTGHFAGSPAGLALDSLTGVINPSGSVPGNYVVTYTVSDGCGGIAATATAVIQVASMPPGNPAVFGDHTWTVYGWNSGNGTLSGNPWTENYVGYYQVGGVNFNTLDQWDLHGSPSDATGWSGCPVRNEFHSWSAKRKGFPCNYYSLKIGSHSQAAQVWVNGVKVWEHDGCCDEHLDIWEGYLGDADSVEFRVTKGTITSMGILTFTSGELLAIHYNSSSFCASSNCAAPSISGALGGVFSSSPGLALDPQTGIINPSASAAGNYVVTYHVPVPCDANFAVTTNVQIIQPQGNPIVYGQNQWFIYAWNAGGLYTSGGEFSANYAGRLVYSDVNLNTVYAFNSTNTPSGASNFEGCPVSESDHSWSAKRQGFPCGYYSLSLGYHTGSVQLFINDSLILYDEGYMYHDNIWRGYLGVADRVELRVRGLFNGSSASVNFTVSPESPFYYASNSVCASAGSLVPIRDGNSGGIFSAAPSGLSINASTGVIDNGTSLPGSYQVSYAVTTPCGASYVHSFALNLFTPAGNPLVYGANTWNVYAWNAGGSGISPGSWSGNYSGYYTSAGLNFNTENSWSQGGSPSQAPGYQGCVVGADNHSWSAKRKGFPCGYYRLDIPGHDDGAQLWVNQVLVWQHDGCCDGHNDVWRGYLGTSDSIEFRVTEGNGGSYGSLAFTAITPNTLSYALPYFCIGSTVSLAPLLTGASNGIYTASPSGLNINPVSGIISGNTSQPGIYTVSFTAANAGTCNIPAATTVVRASVPLGINQPANMLACGGNPSPVVAFSGGSGSFAWTNSNPAIGLAGSGVGNLPSFLPVNNSNSAITATITVRPTIPDTIFSGHVFWMDNDPFTATLSLNGVTPHCGDIKAFPGIDPTYASRYQVRQLTNRSGAPVCATIRYTSSYGDLNVAAYRGSFDPNAIALNYMADGGVQSISGSSNSFSVILLPGDTALLVIYSTLYQDAPYEVTVSQAALCVDQRSFQITVNPAPSATISYPAASLCVNGSISNVSRTGVAGGVYSATPAGLQINPATGAITPGSSAVGIYTVSYMVAAANACASFSTTTAVTISALPDVASVPNKVVCSGSTVAATIFTGAPGYSWTNSNPAIGLAASGTGSLPSFVATNSTNASLTATITVSPRNDSTGCIGKGINFSITVKPAPTVTVPANTSLCAGAATSITNFSSPVAGTIFSWTNTNTTIGLTASGTGSIPSFICSNNTGTVQTATVQVTPLASACTGTPQSFTYTVTPSAGSIAYTGSPFCQSGWAYVTRTGSTGGAFSATPAGLVLDATTGAINLALSTPGNYTITYTVGSAGGSCSNVATTSITVLSQPTVNSMGNPVYCAGVVTPATPFSGTATSYSWTNSNPGIGLAASGTGNALPSFTTVNNTTASISGTISVTPLGGGSCPPGKAISYRITIYPKVVTNAVANQVYCAGISTAPVVFSTNLPSGVTYAWTRTAGSIGLAATSGTTNIPAFTAGGTTNTMVSSTVTVTGTANKCPGAPIQFQYIVGGCVTQVGGSGGNARMMSSIPAKWNLVLAPNPTHGRVLIHVEGKQHSIYTVTLLSTSGQAIGCTATFGSAGYILDLSGLPAGSYFVQVTDKQKGELLRRTVIKL
jgi:hypothetical protein